MKSASTRPISARKRAAVLAAARGSFLSHGFAATNLDDVARAAGVSKMTIYSHFTSKEDLFTAVLSDAVAERASRGPALDASVDASAVEQTLVDIGADLVETVEDEEIIGLRRILIAEQPRHPGPAAAWRRDTVQAATATLAAFFDELQRQGHLVDVDPPTLASQFLWMLIGDRVDSMLLQPGAQQVAPRQHAAGVARVVLAAYGPRIPT